ncbi:uncharacterized protein PV09_03347 [Verruconis gallopava]|uniref:Elongin-A n=1 Tax=Verruconis gallopava TaxID=253628 RepID=A0A0D2AEQ7_9PEZI|nr:uncharacterized protein PV09_03347 [Verruconis gallopava]KIW05458.1 hypothetical protein PV09_03347 [Verruconis gallopava]
MAPSSLERLCTNTAIRNLNRIDEKGLGVTPWRLLKPILNKCENPKMLAEWEKNSPQIRGETGDIWLKFIKRDIPNWREKLHAPSNPELWSEVYQELKREADMEESQAGKVLMDKMSRIKRDEAEWKVAPPTQAIPEKKGRNKGIAMQFQRGSDNNGLRFTTGSKTKDFMQSVRRQAAESKLQKSGVLARPTKFLRDDTTAKKIFHAPQHMVEDKQRQAELARHNAQRILRVSKHEPELESRSTHLSLTSRAARDVKMREERLKAVRDGKVNPGSPFSPTSYPRKPASENAKAAPFGLRLPVYSKGSRNAPTALERQSASLKQMGFNPKTVWTDPVSRAALTRQSNPGAVQGSSGMTDNFRAPKLDATFFTPDKMRNDHDSTIFTDRQSMSTGKNTHFKNKDDAALKSGYRPHGTKKTLIPTKTGASTAPLEEEKGPPKVSFYPGDMHEGQTSAPRIAPLSAPLGVKRKAGPTILLPVKRTKR